MQTVKREFFAMRNGIIADTYRKAGTVFKIVFGLNLPQLVEIAGRTPHSRELAEALWANTTTRESMLLARCLWILTRSANSTPVGGSHRYAHMKSPISCAIDCCATLPMRGLWRSR